MSKKLVTIYSVSRYPATAGAKLQLGYNPTVFEVVADSEWEAVSKAQNLSRWDRTAFSWRVTGSRVEVVDSD